MYELHPPVSEKMNSFTLLGDIRYYGVRALKLGALVKSLTIDFLKQKAPFRAAFELLLPWVDEYFLV